MYNARSNRQPRRTIVLPLPRRPLDNNNGNELLEATVHLLSRSRYSPLFCRFLNVDRAITLSSLSVIPFRVTPYVYTVRSTTHDPDAIGAH